ncbi:MAG: AAA family ATPase [Thermomicrobiales bacterium]
MSTAAKSTALLVDAVPLLTLTGPGGVGKTRLALTIANDISNAFADGVVWVDLSSLTDSAHVASTVAAALGEALPNDMSALTHLVHTLHHQQLLLLLDNCEHVLDITSELVASILAACPAVQAMAGRVPGYPR